MADSTTSRQAPPERPSPTLMRGLAAAWVGVVVAVSLCTLLAMSWAFQRMPAQLVTEPEIGFGGPIVTLPSLFPSAQPSTPEQGTPAAQPTPLPNQDRTFGYGIQAAFASDAETTFDRVQDLGMTWIKIPIQWADVEPEPGVMLWEDLDALIAEAASRNLKVLVTISAAPDWSRSVTTRGKNGPPDDVQAYARFVLLIVQRYRGAIHAVEIWDEQNTDRGWYTAGGLSSASYISLLAPASQAIRQADSGIMLISGALAPTGRDDGVSAVDDFRYVQELIDAGMLDWVDCVGVHHVGFNLAPTLSAEDAFSGGLPFGTHFTGPFDPANPVNPHHSWSFYSTLNGYHNMIIAAGRETPLCVTRFGWASATGMTGAPADVAFADDNTLQEQAEYDIQAFQNMHDWGFVRLAILFNLDYSLLSSDAQPDPGMYFSLLKPDGLPRPAYEAVRDMPKPP